jgi:hypothetical protein
MIGRNFSIYIELDLTMSAFAFILIAVFVVACVGGICAFLALAWNLLRIPFHMKPRASAPLGNPLNAIFAPDVLTEVGLVARRRSGLALLAFLAMVAAAAVSGGLAMVLAQ